MGSVLPVDERAVDSQNQPIKSSGSGVKLGLSDVAKPLCMAIIQPAAREDRRQGLQLQVVPEVAKDTDRPHLMLTPGLTVSGRNAGFPNDLTVSGPLASPPKKPVPNLPTVSPKQIPQEIASPQQRNVLTSPSEAIEDIHASVLNENHIFNGPIPTTATKIREQARAANRAAGVIEKLSPMDLSPYLSLEMIDLPVLGPYMLNNGATYLGQFMHGLKHGRGRMVFPDGSVFEGIFKKDLFDGFGRLVTADACMYEGEWSNHLQTGNGVERGEEGTKYEGEFLDNKYHGWGQLESKPWAYSGYFKGGLFEGEGTLQFPDKSTYQGAFLQGKPHGPGLFTWPDREKYIGEYRMGKKHGSGTMHYKDGSKYQGRFEAGLPQGEGTFTDKDGTAHAGKWAKGKLIK